MVILLTGSSGFIGQRLARALTDAGHTVIEARRDDSGARSKVDADFTRDLHVSDWLPKLEGVDAVVNAVGILREHGAQTFERIHTLAPKALFAACAASGVRRVVQISALGADTGTTSYFSSKRATDEYLATLPLDWTIVQPAVVYGPGGSSARLFTMLASLPIVPLPGSGEQQLQPIHVDDLVAAILQLLHDADCLRQRVALVGRRSVSLRELLARLRTALGLRPTFFMPMPMPLMHAGARVAELSRYSLLDRETLTMLDAGNTADVAQTERLLQHAPRPVEAFIDPTARDAALMQARLMWLLPVLRVSIAAVWIWTGIVSLWLYPHEASHQLLARTGITGTLASVSLYAAAALDLLFGLATLFLHRRRWLWLAQMTLILAYTAIITVRLPEFWLHPYGPILKNLPLLAAIFLLYSLEKTR